LRRYVVQLGDSASVICCALGREYSADAWRDVLRWNGLLDGTLETRLALAFQADMPRVGAELEEPGSWLECLAKDDGEPGSPRCFWRLRSPGPLGPYGLPASGPLCRACSLVVGHVLGEEHQP
jgi:hypothetical protein